MSNSSAVNRRNEIPKIIYTNWVSEMIFSYDIIFGLGFQ